MAKLNSGLESLRTFHDIAATQDNWVEYEFKNSAGVKAYAQRVRVWNEEAAKGGDSILWSWDGVNVGGRLEAGEKWEADKTYENSIYIKNSVAGSPSKARVWAL